MKKKIRVRITKIHKRDAHYINSDRFVGQEGEFVVEPPHHIPGYVSGTFYADKGGQSALFYAVRYKKLCA